MQCRMHREPGKCHIECCPLTGYKHRHTYSPQPHWAKQKEEKRQMRRVVFSLTWTKMRWQSCKIVRFVSFLVRDSYINNILLLLFLLPRSIVSCYFLIVPQFVTLIFIFFAMENFSLQRCRYIFSGLFFSGNSLIKFIRRFDCREFCNAPITITTTWPIDSYKMKPMNLFVHIKSKFKSYAQRALEFIVESHALIHFIY